MASTQTAQGAAEALDRVFTDLFDTIARLNACPAGGPELTAALVGIEERCLELSEDLWIILGGNLARPPRLWPDSLLRS